VSEQQVSNRITPDSNVQFDQSPRYSTTVSGQGISRQWFQLQSFRQFVQRLYIHSATFSLTEERNTDGNAEQSLRPIYATNSTACEPASS